MAISSRLALHSKYPVGLSPSDHAILREIIRYKWLSARQICRLLYSPGSLTFVQHKLRVLTSQDVLQRIFIPRTSRAGSSPCAYSLGREGLKWLRQQGVDIRGRRRATEARPLSYLFLSHTLACNDFLIGAALLERTVPGIVLNSMVHEQDLRRSPVIVASGDERLTVIPDGWLEFHRGESEQICFTLELDRGTEERPAWRRKVRALVAYAQGPYQQQFRTRSLTIAVLAVPGEQRLKELLRWTEAELTELGPAFAALFRFSSASPIARPEDLFLAPCWFKPFDDQPLPLIELPN